MKQSIPAFSLNISDIDAIRKHHIKVFNGIIFLTMYGLPCLDQLYLTKLFLYRQLTNEIQLNFLQKI